MNTESSSETQFETDRTLIEAELQRLLRQKKFSAAAQMSAFLKYIVAQTLDGNGDRIKAYTVGVDALGKPDSFDAQNDPSVRVLALRLRKCLNASYEHDGGLHHARIVLKVGTYVPEFLKAAQIAEEEHSTLQAGRAPVSDVHTDSTDSQSERAHPVPAGSGQSAGSSTQHGHDASEPEKADSIDISFRTGSWMASGMLVLVVIGWAFNAVQNDSFAQQVASRSTDAHINDTSVWGMPPAVTAALQDADTHRDSAPTVYIPGNVGGPEHINHISMLLGSSLVQRGNVEVVRVSSANAERRITGNGYWLVIEEIPLDSGSAVVAQLLRPDSGAVVMSSTLTLKSDEAGFSEGKMDWIETLASDISNATGPVFRNHCADISLQAADTCLQVAHMTSEDL